MKSIKPQILQIIYDAFEAWASPQSWACKRGCSACCTQNVTISAVEGEYILDHIIKNDKQQWLVDKLQSDIHPQQPQQTINQFAAACLAGKETEEEDPPTYSPCPFLEESACSIYPARPFGCRCFLSLHRCSPNRSAVVSESYIAASTTLNQLIEHLGQGEYWGNMLDVLPALLDQSKYRSIAEKMTNNTSSMLSRTNVLTAQPLPGFMIGNEEYNDVAPLLESIFNQTINGKTVEDILNGK